MRMSRDTVRIVVPPLLALGLVAALTHPADAVTTPPTPPVAVHVAVTR